MKKLLALALVGALSAAAVVVAQTTVTNRGQVIEVYTMEDLPTSDIVGEVPGGAVYIVGADGTAGFVYLDEGALKFRTTAVEGTLQGTNVIENVIIADVTTD